MQCFGENGIIQKAKQAKVLYENSITREEESLNELLQEYNNMMAEPEVPTTGPNGKPLVTTLTEKQNDTVTAEDSKGNQVVVPGGFKVRTDLGDTVQKGIVIEDEIGNQFVWIPLGKVIKDDGSETKDIVLGRYTFDETNGTPTLVQNADNYTQTVTIEDYQELSTFRESNYSGEIDGLNATAKDLKGFVESSKANKGYYLARYEASYGSGSSVTNYKPLSQKSTANSEDSMNYTKGTLWNFINQGDASKVSRNMYAGNSYVVSDLVNSYAWDTAIVYIQECSNNSNYANKTDGNGTLKNTGETGDVVCNIYDMSGNEVEWTTEYCSYKDDYKAYPFVVVGSDYAENYNSSSFRNGYAFCDARIISFRPLFWCAT